MANAVDFIVIGAGSSGAVIASRLSEDPACTVALLEAGGTPPRAESIPAACGTLQLNPAVDWMYTADPGKAGLGLHEGRMMVPRGKMLGGSSGINYMAYVRGHPGDFDGWAAGGAKGWSYDEVLPYFRKSEGLVASPDIDLDEAAHRSGGPLGVSVRSPVLDGARAFVAAAQAAGIPRGDYNGRDRGGPEGVVSLFQTTTLDGKRCSTYHAFLKGEPSQRANLRIVTEAHVTRLLFEEIDGQATAVGVEYRDAAGQLQSLFATKEVVLSAGAIGSPHLLMLSGVGPRAELEAAGVRCRVDAPHVGKHLKDHLHVGIFFPAPGTGVSVAEVGMGFGPDMLRAPAGPLPADPADDVHLPPALQALKQEAQRRLMEWATTGKGMIASSMYDASAWFSTGLGDAHTHDAQIAFFGCGGDAGIMEARMRTSAKDYFGDPEKHLAPTAESVFLFANPVQPHSEGEIVLESSDPARHPVIRMNYFADPHDMKVMLAVLRKALAIAANWPGPRTLGRPVVPPALAARHGYRDDGQFSDALLEDLALHYAWTVYHVTSTCRIGSVVDPSLRVFGVRNLRVADASVMPNVISGNTNAPSIMIGEKAAEIIAAAHGVKLANFVGGAAATSSA